MLTTKKRLILAGAGGFAHEVVWLCGEIPPSDRDWELAGFVDDNPARAAESLRAKGVLLPVLGPITDYKPKTDEVIGMAIGGTRAKLDVGGRLLGNGATFVNLIHPTVSIMNGATLGVGCVLLKNALVSAFVKAGNFLTLNNCAALGHDVVAEDGVTLSSFCDVTAGAILRRGAFMGSHATVVPGVEVGEFAVIGAGSAAIRKVKAGTTVLGVPAKEFC